jgi:hypothetical protein
MCVIVKCIGVCAREKRKWKCFSSKIEYLMAMMMMMMAVVVVLV